MNHHKIHKIHKINGMSLIEVLVALLLLGCGLSLFAQSALTALHQIEETYFASMAQRQVRQLSEQYQRCALLSPDVAQRAQCLDETIAGWQIQSVNTLPRAHTRIETEGQDRIAHLYWCPAWCRPQQPDHQITLLIGEQ